MATEGAAFCPNPKCGNAFFLETPSNPQEAQTVLCPNCNVSAGYSMKIIIHSSLFQIAVCLQCRMRKSECICNLNAEAGTSAATPEIDENHLQAMKSLQLIHDFSKPCPKCHAPTEKNGGCNHMHCSRCGHHWCWICQTDWTEDCQWYHWFE